MLDAGREVYKAYFKYTDPRQVREELKLGRADAGWYQIRNALKARSTNGDVPPEAVGAQEVERLDAAYKTLTEKLRPLVREYGFLK